jgi:hypothetical protein
MLRIPADSLPLVSPVKSEPGRYETAFRIVPWIVLAAAFIAVVWARVRLCGLPLERDEGEYAYAGQLILRGIAPYKLAYTMKFPGTAAVYALLMSIFGESGCGIHLGLIVANALTIVLIFFLGRNLFDEIPAIAAAAAYSVLSLMPHVLGTAAHATHFVILFSVAGTWALIHSIDRKSGVQIFLSGLLFGVAILMKQPGLFFAVFGAVYLFIRDYQARLKPIEIVRRNALFALGGATPFAIACLVLWTAGVFREFWFWTITYAAKYGSQVSLPEGIRILGGHILGTLGTAWPIWLVGMIGLIVCIRAGFVRGRSAFLLMFALFSAAAVCPGFYFRPHYFILLLPAVSLLAGAAMEAVCRRADKFRLGAVLLFTLSLAWPVWSEADFFFQRSLPEANRMINGTNSFLEAIKIGEYIRANSNPEETIAVLGSEPEIYFHAGRRSATGYIYTYGLMEPQPYAHQMQEEMIHEIEAARPKFLVLVVANKSWLVSRDSDLTIFRWTDSYCDANYDEVGLINISDEGTDYYLSGKPPTVKPAAEHILIYRRKT